MPIAPHLSIFSNSELPDFLVGLTQQRPFVTPGFKKFYGSNDCDFGSFPYLENFKVRKGFWDSILCLNYPNGNGYLDDTVSIFS